MKVIDNCRLIKHDCPYLIPPIFQAGFTGKSGWFTWFHCSRFGEPVRDLTECDVAGDQDTQDECFACELGKGVK